jgi:hypothetical protein
MRASLAGYEVASDEECMHHARHRVKVSYTPLFAFYASRELFRHYGWRLTGDYCIFVITMWKSLASVLPPREIDSYPTGNVRELET